MAEPKRPESVNEAQRRHLKANPVCEITGSISSCQAHHIVDYYACVMIGRPKLAEYPGNFITLTEGDINAHLLFGHFGDFQSINLGILTNLDLYRQMVKDLMTNMAIKADQRWRGWMLHRIKPVHEWDDAYCRWFELEVEKIFPKGVENGS